MTTVWLRTVATDKRCGLIVGKSRSKVSTRSMLGALDSVGGATSGVSAMFFISALISILHQPGIQCYLHLIRYLLGILGPDYSCRKAALDVTLVCSSTPL